MTNTIEKYARATKKGRLNLQREILTSIGSSHTSWIDSTGDPESQRLHREIIDFVSKSADYCRILIENLGT